LVGSKETRSEGEWEKIKFQREGELLEGGTLGKVKAHITGGVVLGGGVGHDPTCRK